MRQAKRRVSGRSSPLMDSHQDDCGNAGTLLRVALHPGWTGTRALLRKSVGC
jgi:hypothetical protein